MAQLFRTPQAMLPMMVGFAAAASLLLLKGPADARPRWPAPGRPMPVPPARAGVDFTAMRRRLLGLAPSHVTALLGPPRAKVGAAAGVTNEAPAEDTWYYPLQSLRGAMAIQFDRTRHATAVLFVPTPV